MFSKPRYSEEVSLKFGRQFIKQHFGERASIPNGSRCVWLAGVRFLTDQPGCYLVAGSTGLEGIQIIPKAQAMEAKAS